MAVIINAPLAEMKGKFQSKEKLVEKLLEMVKKEEGQSKDEIKGRLLKTSNKKLLNLHRRYSK